MLSPLIITFCILLITWIIINDQIEELAANRTSEYASSIAKISADLSAEPLLSEDKLQLNLIVKNIARNHYIYQATIYSEDGQIASQYPEQESLPQQKRKLTKTTNSLGEIFINSNKNIPYIEKIVYQNITAGWFKIDINKSLLEADFKSSFKNIQIMIFIISSFFFSLLAWYLFNKNKSINTLITTCHNLLMQNNLKPFSNKKEWLMAVNSLSQSEHLEQAPLLTNKALMPHWEKCNVHNNVIILFLEFEIPMNMRSNPNELSTAFYYFLEAIKSFGATSQGDILSSVIISFESQDHENAINNGLNIIVLVKKLFKTITSEIKIKSILSQADIIHFFNHTKNISNILVKEQQLQLIKKQFNDNSYDKHCFLNINNTLLEKISHLQGLELAHNENFKGSFVINQFPKVTNPQIMRKFKHIIESVPFYKN